MPKGQRNPAVVSGVGLGEKQGQVFHSNSLIFKLESGVWCFGIRADT